MPSPKQIIAITLLLSGLLRGGEEPWPKLEPSGDGFEAPPGFKSEVIAADPVVNNPASMCVAPDGRIFYGEDYVHAHVPGKKRDAVKVLTGADKAGHFTQALTLAEDLGSVQGLAFSAGKLFIAHTPKISVLEVSADNKPGKLEDFIVGVGIASASKASHCTSGLKIHDGKLYIVFGDQGCDITTKEGGRIKLDCGAILRCNLDGSLLEIFASGFRNVYGIDFDDSDNVFVRDNTNDGGGYNLRSYHAVKGAYFGWPFRWRESDSKNPPVDVLSFSHDMGGGSPTGCVFLDMPAFPAQFNRGVLFCEWGNGLMVFSKPNPTGATFDIIEHPFLVQAKKKGGEYTFRPTNAALDHGSVLISDWGSAGLYPERGKGRIVRLTYNGTVPAVAPSELQALNAATPSAALMEKLNSADPLIRAKAAYLLGEQKYAPAAEKLTALAGDAAPYVRLRALTALGDLKDPRLLPVFIRALGTEKERWVRRLILRGIRECGDFSALLNNIEAAPPEIQCDLLYACREIYDPQVSGALIHLSANAKLPALRATAAEFLGLIAKKEEARWAWGDKPHFDQPIRTVEWEESAKIMAQLHALIHDADPLVKTAALNALFKLRDTSVVSSLIGNIEAGKAKMDDDTAVILVHSAGNEAALPALAKYAESSKAGEEARREIVRALSVQQLPGALEALRAVAFDAAAPVGLAAEAVDSLGRRKDKASAPKLLTLLRDGQPELQRAAARALGNIGDAGALAGLVAASESSDRALKAEALIALSRADVPPKMEHLLPALLRLQPAEDAMQSDIATAIMGAKKERMEPLLALWLQSQLLGPQTKSEVRSALEKSSKNKFGQADEPAALGKFLAKNYPEWRAPAALAPLPKELEEGDHRLERLTREALTAKGDPVKGAALFTNKRGANCTGCHAVQLPAGMTGAHIGPDLTGVGAKYPRPYLIESVLYPSKQLLDGYEMTVLALKSGERLSGIVQREDKSMLSLAKSDGSVVTLALDEISKRQKSKNSLMPDGLVNALSDQDFFDLIAFLESLKKQKE